MKKVKTKTNPGISYKSPECASLCMEVLVPLCTSSEDDEADSGLFDEEIWGKEYRL